MKTVVITGSARGLGFNMARFFREYNYNVVISDLNEEKLILAKEELEKIKSEGNILYKVCNVSKLNELEELMRSAITEFTTHSLGDEAMELSEKTKKVYNILGDTPQTVGKFLVDEMIKNTKNNVKINWLTNRKAFVRFLTAGFNKRNFFGSDQRLLTEKEDK